MLTDKLETKWPQGQPLFDQKYVPRRTYANRKK